jgi:hypothetical protein
MAKAETRAKEKEREATEAEGVNDSPSADELSPLERMTDLTRRIIQVPKSEVNAPKDTKRRRQTP